MKERIIWLELLLVVVATMGCRTESPAPTAPDVMSTAAARPDEEPGTFEPAPCAFALPEDTVQGEGVDCGYLIVPERRELTDGGEQRTIRLAVAIFRAPGPVTLPDPVVYLSGGPGASALETLRYGLPDTFNAILASGRDLVVFDQRGVGRSRPALDCPRVTELSTELADRRVDGTPIGKEAAADLMVQAFLDCGEALGETANLSAYNSATSAADVADLRRGLGCEEVNLWGGSYGTRLALEVMRLHPEGLRSVVLDAVYPPDVDLYAEAPANFERALDRLFESCEATSVCSTNYPDLRQTFLSTVAHLNAEPAPSTLTDVRTGDDIPALMDGDALVGLVFQLLYSTEAKLLIPELIMDASRNDFAAIENHRSSLLGIQSVSSRAMMFSVQCHEEVPFSVRDASALSEARYPELAGTFAHGLLGELTYRVCEGWPAGRADPSANEPVYSSIPTLIMTGEFDPITPPEWGVRVAETLTRAYAFEYPGVGHGASALRGCPQDMFLAFLEDPTTAPASTCIAEMTRNDR